MGEKSAIDKEESSDNHSPKPSHDIFVMDTILLRSGETNEIKSDETKVLLPAPEEISFKPLTVNGSQTQN